MTTSPIAISAACLLCAVLVTGCATTPTSPLGPNEARISGRTATFFNSSRVFLARADQPSPRQYEHQLVIPAGKNRLALRYNDRAIPFPIITNAIIASIEEKYDKEVELDAKPGHEYYADCIIKTWVIGFGDIDYRITDTTTGEVVVETHGKP